MRRPNTNAIGVHLFDLRKGSEIMAQHSARGLQQRQRVRQFALQLEQLEDRFTPTAVALGAATAAPWHEAAPALLDDAAAVQLVSADDGAAVSDDTAIDDTAPCANTNLDNQEFTIALADETIWEEDGWDASGDSWDYGSDDAWTSPDEFTLDDFSYDDASYDEGCAAEDCNCQDESSSSEVSVLDDQVAVAIFGSIQEFGVEETGIENLPAKNASRGNPRTRAREVEHAATTDTVPQPSSAPVAPTPVAALAEAAQSLAANNMDAARMLEFATVPALNPTPAPLRPLDNPGAIANDPNTARAPLLCIDGAAYGQTDGPSASDASQAPHARENQEPKPDGATPQAPQNNGAAPTRLPMNDHQADAPAQVPMQCESLAPPDAEGVAPMDAASETAASVASIGQRDWPAARPVILGATCLFGLQNWRPRRTARPVHAHQLGRPKQVVA